MEQVIKVFEELNLKAKNLEEAMLILPQKPHLMEELTRLKVNSDLTKSLTREINESTEHYEKIVKKQYEEVSETTKRVQLKMLYLLEHFNKVEDQQQNEKRALKPLDLPGTPKLFDRDGAKQAFSELNTPRMQVSEFAKSPFAKKRSKIQLHFTDFEAEISSEDFLKIPAYMRGRASQSELQEFLENVVIRTFNHKYKILFQHRASLMPSEFNLQSMFKSQTNYFEGQKFITIGDIARILEKNVEKKDERFLQMLRHLQVIREARKNSTVCYIWLRS